MELTFQSKNPKQIQASKYWLDDTIDEILYGGAKNGGKSFLGCSLIFGDALIYPETHYFIVRSELNDLRKYTLPTVHKVFKNWGIEFDRYAQYNGQDNFFSLYNNSKVYFLDCKDKPSDPLYERFGSMEMTRGWIEEAGEVPEAAYENLKLALGRMNNDIYNLTAKLFITCNPKKNWLYRLFYLPNKEGTLTPNKRFVKALVTDNKHAEKGAVERLDNIKDKITRQRLRYGNWEYDDSKDRLHEYDAILDLFTNSFVGKNSKGDLDGEKFLSCDVALMGSDLLVVFLWIGFRVQKIFYAEKCEANEVLSFLEKIAEQEKVPRSHIVADVDGVGSFLRGFLVGIKSFVNNSKAIEYKFKSNDSQIYKENYQNLKSQCAYKLADKVNKREFFINIDQIYSYNQNTKKFDRDVNSYKIKEKIIEEFEAIKRKDIDKDGKLAIIPKEDIKEDIGRSPDFYDAAMMRMFFDLKKDPVFEIFKY